MSTVAKLKHFYRNATINTTGSFPLQLGYVCLGLFFVLLSSGLVFGWASLLLVFQAEGVYAELCDNNNSTTPVAVPMASQGIMSFVTNSRRAYMAQTAPVASTELCDAQTLRFDLIYLLGLLAIFFPNPLLGWIGDHFGARVLLMCSATMLSLGSIFFAFGYHTSKLDMLMPGLMFTAAGGMGFILSILPFGKLIPAYVSSIVAFYSVAFDSSPLVYYIYVKVYQAYGLSPRTFFLSYLTIPLLALCMTLFFWPRGVGEPEDEEATKASDPNSLELSTTDSTTDSQSTSDNVTLDLDATTTNTAVDLDSELAKEPVKAEELVSELGPTDLYLLPFKEQLFRKESFFLCLLHINCSFWLSAYMGSIQARLKGMNDDMEEVESYTEAFGLVLSLAFLCAPLVGYSIYKLKILKSTLVCVTLALFWMLAQFLPFKVQIGTFILFAFVRAWYYSISFNLLTQIFGWKNVGKLWGLYNAASGFFAFSYYGISWMVVHWLDGSFFIINIISTIMFAANFLFYFYFKVRKDRYEASVASAVSLPTTTESA